MVLCGVMNIKAPLSVRFAIAAMLIKPSSATASAAKPERRAGSVRPNVSFGAQTARPLNLPM
jgi:hypothetical protein